MQMKSQKVNFQGQNMLKLSIATRESLDTALHLPYFRPIFKDGLMKNNPSKKSRCVQINFENCD
jgi:hypothetical protein